MNDTIQSLDIADTSKKVLITEVMKNNESPFLSQLGLFFGWVLIISGGVLFFLGWDKTEELELMGIRPSLILVCLGFLLNNSSKSQLQLIKLRTAIREVLTQNKANQQVDPIVKTPGDEVEAQGTQGHP